MMESMTSDVESYRAALASLLGMDLDRMPRFDGLPGPLEWDAWLARELNMASLRFNAGAIPIPPGMWLARIVSPYPGYRTHTVVMARGGLAHDPHPEPQEYLPHERLALMELLIPLDPSEPSGPFG